MERCELDLYFCDYARGVMAAGGLPVYLPPDVDANRLAGRLDGLLLSGGADVDPALYGQGTTPELSPLEPTRDAFEMAMLDGAAAAGIPALGICRGLQVMNVHGGGTLHQHVPSHACYEQPIDAVAHDVEFTPGSIAASLYGPSRPVNSVHHQTVDVVADGFMITGRAPDGVVEVIEATDRAWLSVQWHPELMESRDDDALFAWLVQAASGAVPAPHQSNGPAVIDGVGPPRHRHVRAGPRAPSRTPAERKTTTQTTLSPARTP